jgi:hypothetical protein
MTRDERLRRKRVICHWRVEYANAQSKAGKFHRAGLDELFLAGCMREQGAYSAARITLCWSRTFRQLQQTAGKVLP